MENNKYARDNKVFVGSLMQNLLALGCVSAMRTSLSVINPPTVVSNRSGKSRLVLDCRYINMVLHKFKYENSSVARELFVTGDLVCTSDLKAAYHHIECYQDHRQFLRFARVVGRTRHFYLFTDLPF